jgi:hypothetical protein
MFTSGPGSPGLAPLPRERGSLVGGDRELRSIARALDDHLRLVTLHGAAGIGKTRLALRGGADRQRLGQPVLYCDLGGARTLQDVCRGIAAALSVSLAEISSPTDSLDALGRALAWRGSSLLVLD